eukprot:6532199-Prymnesium_polylepis.3
MSGRPSAARHRRTPRATARHAPPHQRARPHARAARHAPPHTRAAAYSRHRMSAPPHQRAGPRALFATPATSFLAALTASGAAR